MRPHPPESATVLTFYGEPTKFNFIFRITTENTRATIPVTTAPNVAPIVGPVIAVCVVALLLVVVVGIMIRRKRGQCGKMYSIIVSVFLP